MTWRPIWPWLLDWGLPVALGALLWCSFPLDTALEFGTDEGFELMKALLVSRGHSLYGPFWNDQPPLHTAWLAALFHVFGPSAYVGRLLTLGFAAVMVRALYDLVRERTNRSAAVIAVALLAGSPFFLQLSVSVMLELPAMALALASVWGWFRYLRFRHTTWLVLSGALFGVALQVKYTAILFLPALAVDYFAARSKRAPDERGTSGHGGPGAWREPYPALLWGGACIAAFGLVAALFYSPSTFDIFLSSHFSHGTRELGGAGEHRFEPESIFRDWGVVVPAAVGATLIARRWRRDLLLPLVLLAVVTGVHAWNRPFWHYYSLHFSIPLAWLASVGIVESFREFLRAEAVASLWSKLRLAGLIFAWAAVTSLALTTLPGKLSHESAKVRIAVTALDDPVVAAFISRSSQARWVFTHNRTAAFWAGLAIPPELAVIPSKRVWSEQITKEEVMACLERYRPELILIPSKWELLFELGDHLEKFYLEDLESGVSRLFVRRPEQTD